MANEASVSVSLLFSKNAVSGVGRAIQSLGRDVAGANYVQYTVPALTSGIDLNLGGIGTPGLIFLHNLDTTNFVIYRNGSAGTDTIKLMPGDIAVFRAAAGTPHVIADTATSEVEVLILEA